MQQRLDETEPFLNAYITRMDDEALAAARAAEAEIAGGTYRGPLHGVPVAIKDNIAVAGTITTAGAKVLAENLTLEDADRRAAAESGPARSSSGRPTCPRWPPAGAR